jgi:hypothetical protein
MTTATTNGASRPAAAIAWNAVDRRMWEEELDEFVPRRVFDVHTHLYRWDFNLDPHKENGPYKPILGQTWANATWQLATACEGCYFPVERSTDCRFLFRSCTRATSTPRTASWPNRPPAIRGRAP